MIRSFRRGTAVVLLACSLAIPAAARQASPAAARPADAAAVAGKIDEYMQAHVRASGFSGSVLLAHAGTPIVSKGYGWANAEWEIPSTPQTKFRIGSVTKQFTSMAVLQLQEQGKLKVQDSICVYLAPCPDTWKPVTVHHLLTHTSGIPSYTNSPDYPKRMMIPATREEMVARFRELPLEFEPGSQFKYNNSGYFLLGLILEKVTDKDYEQVLRTQIFDPLGMSDTGYDRTDAIIPRRAAGYRGRGNALQNAESLDMLQPFSAGALYSTVTDLLKWDRALYTDKLLPEAARKAMFTPFKDDYAYGWTVRQPSPATSGRRVIGHGGGINGFSSMIVRLPDQDVTAIVLSNNANAPSSRIANDLVGIYFGEPVKMPVVRTEVQIDPNVFDAYVGEYQLAPTFILTVTRDGDRLMTQATGQGKVEIFPESETKFFLRVVDAQITFVKDASGAVTHLILHQGGRDQKAVKTK